MTGNRPDDIPESQVAGDSRGRRHAGSPEPSSRHLIAGGFYRDARNPKYPAFAAAIIGQALLFSRRCC